MRVRLEHDADYGYIISRVDANDNAVEILPREEIDPSNLYLRNVRIWDGGTIVGDVLDLYVPYRNGTPMYEWYQGNWESSISNDRGAGGIDWLPVRIPQNTAELVRIRGTVIYVYDWGNA